MVNYNFKKKKNKNANKYNPSNPEEMKRQTKKWYERMAKPVRQRIGIEMVKLVYKFVNEKSPTLLFSCVSCDSAIRLN